MRTMSFRSEFSVSVFIDYFKKIIDYFKKGGRTLLFPTTHCHRGAANMQLHLPMQLSLARSGGLPINMSGKCR